MSGDPEGLHEAPCAGEVFDAEERPSHEHDQQRVRTGHDGRCALQHLAESRALPGHEGTVDHAPDHEVPARAMPQAGEEEDQEQVHIGACRSFAVAAERDVEVVAEEIGEADVPALPELADAARHIGPVEILQEVEAEHARQTYGHIAVAAEVEVDLRGVRDKSQPRYGWRYGGRVQLEDRVGDARAEVGDEHLLGEAHDETADADREPFGVHHPLGELPGHIVVADDRPRDQLREQRDVQRGDPRAALCTRITAVHVHYVAQAVEDEERNADRQMYRVDLHLRHTPLGEGDIERVSQEVGVLEPDQRGEVGHYGEREHGLG